MQRRACRLIIKEDKKMKKYFTPNALFESCDICDVITASGNKISVDSSSVPTADGIPDYVDF